MISSEYPGSSTNETDRYDITNIIVESGVKCHNLTLSFQ
jgi:hypothetical protein